MEMLRRLVLHGGPTVLTMSEEREIAMTCITLAEMGFGITCALVEVVIFDYLKDNGIENPFHGLVTTLSEEVANAEDLLNHSQQCLC